MKNIVLILAFVASAATAQAASAPAEDRHSGRISGHSSLSKTAETRPQYPNSLTVVAAVLNVSEDIALNARAQNLEEALSWVIMLMAKRCACPVSDLMNRRKSMSWGEVAKSAGYAWVELLEEARTLSDAAGIEPGQASTEQIYRSISNDPGPANEDPGEQP